MGCTSFIVALLSLTFAAAVPSSSVTRRELPAGVSFAGDFVAGKKWKDRKGESIVVLSHRTDQRRRDGVSSYLYGVHWRKTDGGWRTIWEMKDWVESCDLDMTCEFVADSLEVTDLDGNGTAEVSFLYRLGCRGDISPDDQKLLLYEDAKKYALRGMVKVSYPAALEMGVGGGDYKAAPSFAKAPPSFLKFARAQWARLGVELRE